MAGTAMTNSEAGRRRCFREGPSDKGGVCAGQEDLRDVAVYGKGALGTGSGQCKGPEVQRIRHVRNSAEAKAPVDERGGDREKDSEEGGRAPQPCGWATVKS